MESHFLEIKGLKYHYLELPNPGKPKLLLIHGIIVESHYWQKAMTFLEKDYHIFAIDLKGHGQTGDGESYIKDYSPESVAEDFHIFYEKVIQEPFYLAGYSLGGQFALKYASLHQNTLKGFMIIDSAPSLPLKGVFTFLIADMVTPKSFKTIFEVKDFYGKKGNHEMAEYMAEYAFKQTESNNFQLRYDKKNIAPATLMEGMRRNKSLWDSAKKIKIPTIFIKAGKSKLINSRIVMFFKSAIPHMEFVEIPDVGHEFVFTAPEPLAKAMDEFIKKLI
ncbi:MAG TPA: hypothetical protein DHW82_02160 [Spirochaetia bacterium]|nr:MAG: hypothetical protein A2Y41_07100 [Spirochaetes bacterium GWB1_36_13]HCL55799.1 hypothetical protein [Spirochaetia bacterium]